MSVLTADALFNYGRALLENAVKNTDLLGEKNPTKNAETVQDDEEESVSGSEDEDGRAILFHNLNKPIRGGCS